MMESQEFLPSVLLFCPGQDATTRIQDGLLTPVVWLAGWDFLVFSPVTSPHSLTLSKQVQKYQPDIFIGDKNVP